MNSMSKCIVMASGLAVTGFQTKGQALSWDFRVYQPGTYEVVVVSHAGANQVWNVEGRLRAHVAGKSVENKLIEDERVPICTMKSGTVDFQCVLGTVKMNSVGAHTLSLEIASGLTGAKPKLRSVVLDPVTREK